VAGGGPARERAGDPGHLPAGREGRDQVFPYTAGRGVTSVPRVLVTDTLASYGVAHRRLIPGVEHRRSTYLNNRAENVRREVARNEWITWIGGRYRSVA
jgi:transposase-like protein